MKIICMVPARLNSKRVSRKNIRLINGKPLIGYVLETLQACKQFDAIFVNSEAEIFGDIAKHYGVNFYKRPSTLSSDTATNDQFMLDFMNNVDGDVVIQVLPTSPLVTVAEINNFVAEMETGLYDTLISVEHKQIACLFEDKEINFDKLAPNPPSQTMTPVQAYATVLMGWRYNKFKEDMRRFGSGYHGGMGPTGYFELRGLSTLDIDREEDFRLVERIILSQEIQINPVIRYYGEL